MPAPSSCRCAALSALVLLLLPAAVLVLVFRHRMAPYFAASAPHARAKSAHLDALRGGRERPRAAPAPRRRNLILVLADDLGVGDLACFGSRTIATPALDGLAARGVRGTAFYAGASVCTPSRATFLTGRWSPRTGVGGTVLFPPGHPVSFAAGLLGFPAGLLQDEITLAEILGAAGWRTFLVGKWHLGGLTGHLPEDFGFDHHFGSLHSNDMTDFALRQGSRSGGSNVLNASVDQARLQEAYTREIERLLDDAGTTSSKKNQPFFLMYASNAPHEPLVAPAAADSEGVGSQGGVYGDVVEAWDSSVGRMLSALERNGLSDNTLVVVASDNGPWFEGSAGPLRGRKASPWEGGHRSPLIVAGPGVGRPGRVVSAPLHAADLLPTLLTLSMGRADASAAVPNDRVVDGIDFSPTLRGRPQAVLQTRLLPFFQQNSLVAVRRGQWKLHLDHMLDPSELVRARPTKGLRRILNDLAADPGEAVDATRRYPETAAEMWAQTESFASAFESNPRGWRNVDDRVGDGANAGEEL